MTSGPEQELIDAVSGNRGLVERLVLTAGVIATRARDAGIDSLVLSGGAAVALLTARDFSTLDIAFVTPEGDRLDDVLRDLGFERRNDLQHIWSHPTLRVAVQVAGSELPRNSETELIVAPGEREITVWSTADLLVDRLNQALYFDARDRLAQALALRDAAGQDFDLQHARRRAADEGRATEAVLEAFLTLFDQLTDGDPEDRAPEQQFWKTLDKLR